MPPFSGTGDPLLVREVDPEERQRDEEDDDSEDGGRDQARPPARAKGRPADATPEDQQPGDRRDSDHEHGREEDRALEREVTQPHGYEHERRDGDGGGGDAGGHGATIAPSYPQPVAEANYVSGEDYVVEFLGYRFGFNTDDFEERVTAAAVKLGLVADNELDGDETADLVELVERDWINEPRSELGRYLVRHWERVSLVGGEALVYWLKKLVFRGAWLDHRVKEGLLEVAWDEEISDFGYRDPRGGRALLELAPVPSWHELQFRR
jgi:hypothetical protein